MAWVDYSGNLVGGDGQTREISQLTTPGSINQYTNTGSTACEISMGGSTVILELVLVSQNSIGAVGLKGLASYTMNASSSDMSSYNWGRNRSSNAYDLFRNYNFSDKTSDNNIYVGSTAGTCNETIRKVFALHSQVNDDKVYITRAHLLNNLVIKNASCTSTAYYNRYFSRSNIWATYTDGAGVTYKSITVYSDNQFIQTTFLVTKGHKYTFNMHTRSEAGFDGIIISTSALSSSASITSAGIGRCSGVENKSSCTYTATSTGTIYIYFKTDDSGLGEYYQDTSTNGYDYWDDYTTGDIEIIDELIKTVVTFNKNGGSGGSNTITITYGQSMSNIAITTPTRTYSSFAGYYTGNSRNSPGTKYIDSSGSGVNTTWNITSETYTLNALYNYGTNIVASWYPLHCIYCSSSPTFASTLQTTTTITLAGQIISTFTQGTVTYAQYDEDYEGHLGELNMSSDKTVVIPAGTASGDYIFSIEYTAIPQDTTIFTKKERKECLIWIIPSHIVKETMELPDEIPASLTQKKDIPAGNFTLNENNLSEYFEYPMTIPSTTQIIYNNGSSAQSTPQISWYVAQPITFASLGSTITSRQQVAIPDWSFINMSVSKRSYNGDYYDNRTRVIQIISDIVDGDVSYFSQFSDIGIDSLNYVNLIYGLEEEYHISINVNDLREVYSVDLLCKYLYVFHDVGGILSNHGVSNFIDAQYGDNSGDTVYREANTVTNLHISVSKNPIYVNDTATWNTTADFKSGDEGISVNGLETFSGYDTSIININNT